MKTKTAKPASRTRAIRPYTFCEEIALDLEHQRRRHAFDEANNRAMERITPIRCLRNSLDSAGTGIGFQDMGTPDEKLVEYAFNGSEGFHADPITVAQSVQWSRQMLFAESRLVDAKLSEPLQPGDGESHWLEIIQSNLK